ncbi:MAG: DUF2306 domain-containing protein, partial [Planctomycetota bacterium]
SALVALVLGPLIFLKVKGRRFHRIAGYVYVLAMLTVNITALTSYQMSGRPNLFHFFAVVSLTALLPGYFAVRAAVRHRDNKAMSGHAEAMIWSYFGLFMAGLSQVGTRLALPLFTAPWQLFVSVGVAACIGAFATSLMVKRLLPGLMARYSYRGAPSAS